jgi:hypothetical protein
MTARTTTTKNRDTNSANHCLLAERDPKELIHDFDLHM